MKVLSRRSSFDYLEGYKQMCSAHSESHRGVAWMQNTPTHMFILHCNGIHDGDFAVNLEVVIFFSYTTKYCLGMHRNSWQGS